MNKPSTDRKPHKNLPPGMERRKTPRFGCDRGVQCWKDGISAAFWGEFIDLSMTGCCIHTPTPLPPRTRLKMVFTLFGTSIRVSGEVRTLHGAVMGVAFAAMTEAEQAKLSNMLKRLADGRSTNSDVIMNTQAAVLRLERWFKTHDLLTRDLFHRIVDGQFDPATEAKVNPLMDKASARFSVEEVAASMLRR
ncbi:MAG: PilZ domain-containing protein [Terriglobales bacterium]